MPEEKKRFPWWLAAGAVLLAIVAAALGLIETVGREGTIVNRYDRIVEGMPRTEALRILGSPRAVPCAGNLAVWKEGPLCVVVEFEDDNRTKAKDLVVLHPEDTDLYISWHFRRWAEQAYTAIHGPRR